jgi:hypothetical protein
VIDLDNSRRLSTEKKEGKMAPITKAKLKTGSETNDRVIT